MARRKSDRACSVCGMGSMSSTCYRCRMSAGGERPKARCAKCGKRTRRVHEMLCQGCDPAFALRPRVACGRCGKRTMRSESGLCSACDPAAVLKRGDCYTPMSATPERIQELVARASGNLPLFPSRRVDRDRR